MALDDLLATLERQAGTSGTSGAPADVPAKPEPALSGTSRTSGTSENGNGEVQAKALPAWALHFTDRKSAEVRFSPPATLAEALATYSEAVAAEPLPDDAAPRQSEQQGARQSAQESAQKSAVPSCKTCRHLKRPGLSAGYCGGRDDLPPAYTPGHPLRRLPNDGGASCATWELST